MDKYTLSCYKYDEHTLFLTTTDPDNRHSRRVYREELEELLKWLRSTPPIESPSFLEGQDGWFVHRAISEQDAVHFRDINSGGYLYTYVPIQFLTDI